jgi:putative N6-adenine-specific DNA methylase
MKNRERFFATCPRGLEQVLSDELKIIGAADARLEPGGVHFFGPLTLCYRANLHSRIASRILWDIAKRPYKNESDIYKAAYSLSWPEWFDVGDTFRVKVSAIRCPLKSLEFITLKIKDAVCDRFREHTDERPNIDTKSPDVRIFAHLSADRITFYLDTSGEALFKRGYRAARAEAPVRENLAAGILRLSGWQPGVPLLDPMCGSGTFLIEAAMMALNIAPGSDRWFGFEKLKNFDATAWKTIYDEAVAAERPKTALPIFGSDISSRALAAARENLAAAQLDSAVHLTKTDILKVCPPAPGGGVIIANPPYALRIGDPEAMARLYPKIGDWLKQNFQGWRACFFTADLALAKKIHLAASHRIPLYNGALECRLFIYEMVAGSHRKPKPRT